MSLRRILVGTAKVHATMSVARAFSSGGDAPFLTKCLYFLMLGDVPNVNLASAEEAT